MSNTQQKPTIFVKRSTLHVLPRDKCNFCERCGHYAYRCFFKKYNPRKLVWVPKGTLNNLMPIVKIGRSINEGSKLKWVPKRKPPFL